ncbi:unnamed protein product [Rotaria socialis]|uniref:Uncharacterized protein n=1 Tax=Rotaria socialis TaxID=392032 RepID=A0A818VCA4_9BILA|nr:unnamed protein product [Rotaria socialis]
MYLSMKKSSVEVQIELFNTVLDLELKLSFILDYQNQTRSYVNGTSYLVDILHFDGDSLFARDVFLIAGGCPRATFEVLNNTIKVPYNFIESSVGNIGSLETCPYTGRPYVYLPCYQNSSWGDEPYFSPCLKPPDKKEQTTMPSILLPSSSSSPSIAHPYFNISIEELARLPMNSYNDFANVLSDLNHESAHFKSRSNISSVANIIDSLKTNNQNKNNQIYANIYSVVDKLLSSESILKLQEVKTSNRSIVKLLSSLERFTQNLKSDRLEQNFIETNLAVSIVDMPNNRTKPIIGFAFDSIKNQTYPIESNDRQKNLTVVLLDSQALSQQNRLTFSVYNQLSGLFDEKQYRVLTRIISLTIDKPELTKNLGSFVKLNFYLEKNYEKEYGNLTCAYWHIFDNMTAQWSTDGCYLIGVIDRNVMCECNHLTHFAVLMDIEQKPTSKSIEQVLSIITLAGLFLSSIGLCLTILTFIFFAKLRRHFSQKSLLLLSINLLFVNILFSIIGLCRLTHLSCIIIASALHYFILSSFSWMFIMAIIQYLLFVKVFPRTISAFTRKAAAFAQVVPSIPVIAVLAVDPSHYTRRSDGLCWLSDLPFYLSFILPIVLYILINSLVFSIVAHSLLCGTTGQQLRSTQMAESQRVSRFLVALSCFVVLGLTWIFGLLAIGPMRDLFQILFCTFATLTGFFIFLLYIITSKAKRKCWNNAFKTLGISSIYSPTLSTSSGLNGTKEFSTSSTNDQQKVPSRLAQFPSQPQHFIDAYMPSSPPAPAPPLPLPPSFLIEGDDPLNTTSLTNDFYEPKHLRIPQTNYGYESNPPTTSLDDYSLFYAAYHDGTKL